MKAPARSARPARSVVDGDGARRADLAAIHMAKAALGWDDGTYRDILWSVCTVRSAAQLDFTGRKRFLAHLRACGWSGDANGARTRSVAAQRPIKSDLTPTQRLMFSLWQQLADAGLVKHRAMTALIAFAERTTGVSRFEWLKPHQQELVIESLKKWLERGEEPAHREDGHAGA